MQTPRSRRSSIAPEEPTREDVEEPVDDLKQLKRKKDLKVRMVTDAIISPYEYAKSHRHYKKIYPNRVNTLWYRRYADKLPDDFKIDFQPMEEVQRVDEDVALQYFYGEDGPAVSTFFDNVVEKRRLALEKYHRIKEQEEKEKSMAVEEAQHSSQPRYKSFLKAMKAREGADFGASVTERKVLTPIIDFVQKLQIKKRRQLHALSLKADSKWRFLHRPATKKKLAVMFKLLLQELTQNHFRQIIRLVVCATRFINTIRIISGSTKQILKEIQTFKNQQQKSSQWGLTGAKKKMFDCSKYSFKEQLSIPLEILMTLTKPWFMRLEKEIDVVCDLLQAFKSFVQYPPIFQRRLARLAWYIEIEANKYIIRERHMACDFYVLLKGKAKEVRLVGDPYIGGIGKIKLCRYIKKSEAFGDESMSDPECLREYSIVSCEPCALLAISVYDYNTMVHTKKDNEIAPEHIIFLSHLKFLEDFPKRKLLEEGDENITIHYFRPESLITKDLEKANHVFVVINGVCRVVAEIPPERAMTIKSKHFSVDYRSDWHANEVAENFLKSIERSQKDVKRSTLDTQRMKHEFDLHVKKQTSLIEAHRAAISDEINDLRLKAHQILKTLPKTVRDTFNIQNFAKMLQERKMTVASTVESKPQNGSRASDTLSVISGQSFRDPISLEQWVTFASSQALLRDFTGYEFGESFYGTNEVSKTELWENETVSSEKSWVSLYNSERKSKADSEKDSRVSHKPKAVKQEQKLSRLDSVPERNSQAISQRARFHSRSIRPKTSVGSRDCSRYYSKWKFIRSLNRGDSVGHEWLDFNNGPFEKPTEICALISSGCEMVMIKKSFLLKYLRKEW